VVCVVLIVFYKKKKKKKNENGMDLNYAEEKSERGERSDIKTEEKVDQKDDSFHGEQSSNVIVEKPEVDMNNAGCGIVEEENRYC
jgi:hypothetical protein